MKSYGYEKFVKDSGAKILDKHKDCALIGIEDIKLLSLKDSSTDRKYLLRVPPEINTYKEGVAWTFGLNADDYKPVIET